MKTKEIKSKIHHVLKTWDLMTIEKMQLEEQLLHILSSRKEGKVCKRCKKDLEVPNSKHDYCNKCVRIIINEIKK